MRLRIRFRTSGPATERARGERRWVGFAVSAGIHAAAALVTMGYPLGMTVVADGTSRRDVGVRVVELAEERRAAPLVYRPPAGMGKAASASAVARGRRVAAGGRAVREPGGAADVRRGGQVLLQPDTRAVADEDVLVARMTVMEPGRTSRTFIRPPDRAVARQIPKDVVVELAPPSLTGVAEGMAGRSAILRNALLVVPAALRAPVAGEGKPAEEERSASVRGVVSEPATIVSVPDRELPGSRMIAVPAANMSGGGGAAAGGGFAPSRSRPGVGSRDGEAARPDAVAASRNAVDSRGVVEARDGRDAVGGAESGGAAGSRDGAVSRTGADARRAVEMGTAADTRTAVEARGGPGNAPGGADAAGARASAVRIVRPFEGAQDFVVTQSESAIPGSAGLLGCRPVYTVYVPVGTARDWILQYCTPAIPRVAGEREVRVVELGRAEAVTAPYAHVIVRPVARLKPGERYAFLHGFVNAAGRLEKLTEAGGSRLEDSAGVVSALALWEFRPAMKDGLATEVEVLLCIPKS